MAKNRPKSVKNETFIYSGRLFYINLVKNKINWGNLIILRGSDYHG